MLFEGEIQPTVTLTLTPTLTLTLTLTLGLGGAVSMGLRWPDLLRHLQPEARFHTSRRATTDPTLTLTLTLTVITTTIGEFRTGHRRLLLR